MYNTARVNAESNPSAPSVIGVQGLLGVCNQMGRILLCKKNRLQWLNWTSTSWTALMGIEHSRTSTAPDKHQDAVMFIQPGRLHLGVKKPCKQGNHQDVITMFFKTRQYICNVLNGHILEICMGNNLNVISDNMDGLKKFPEKSSQRFHIGQMLWLHLKCSRNIVASKHAGKFNQKLQTCNCQFQAPSPPVWSNMYFLLCILKKYTNKYPQLNWHQTVP